MEEDYKSHGIMAPISEKSRLQHIDSLRGFSLIGILIVNMLSFQYGTVGYEFIFPELSKGNQVLYKMIEWLFQGSFYPLFSILFGFGAVIIYERAQERNRPFYFLYFRRLLILLIFGFIHLHFIWDGDILLTYAISGFLFMFFIRKRKKSLLTIAIILALFINLLGLIPEDGELEDDSPYITYVQLEKEVLTKGSYMEVVEHRFTSSPYDYIYYNEDVSPAEKQLMAAVTTIIAFILIILQTLMLFLVGAYFAKSKLIHQPEEHMDALKKMSIIFVSAGLLLKGMMFFTDNSSLQYVGYFLGGPILTVGYISFFTFIFVRKKEALLTKYFAYAGRMALTNYIVQSLIMTTIFYGYGLGLFGKLGISGGVLLSVFVFFIQTIYSKWWMNRYYFGPLEVVLRTGMYLKRQKLRR